MPRACVRSSPMSLSVLCHHLDSLVNLALRDEVNLVLDENHRDVPALVLHLHSKVDGIEHKLDFIMIMMMMMMSPHSSSTCKMSKTQDRSNCVKIISITIST